jgi:hypothetical protein
LIFSFCTPFSAACANSTRNQPHPYTNNNKVEKKSAPAVKQEADLFARDPAPSNLTQLSQQADKFRISTTPDSIAFGSRMTGLRSG